LFDYKITDYKKWAYGLRKAGYATDKKYPAKLLKIIKDYKLHEFDKIKKGTYTKEIKKLNDGKTSKKPAVVKKNKANVYKVRKGDTLYSISKKFGVSVTVLKKLNKLNDNTISIGQQLLVK
jgi:LysM repeat protein